MLNDLSLFSEAITADRLDAEWSFDRSTGRYRDERGRFLSRKAVHAIVDKRIEKLATKLRRYTRMMADGNITFDQWQQSVREAIKSAHVQNAIIGKGGRDNMTASDYGKIGQRLRQEYSYLQGFALDLLEQKVSMPMALARIGLYAESTRGSYWQGAELRQREQGYSLMRRVLDPMAQHCDDCIRYARAGIVSIGSLPLPGERCECRARCRCSIEYLRQQAPSVPV